MADFTIKSHDQLPSIQATLNSGGAMVDLTSATSVAFIMRQIGGPQTIKVNSPATVVLPATSGVVRYDWASSDTDAPGSYQAEWQVTWAGGKKQTFPTLAYITVDVLADLDGA